MYVKFMVSSTWKIVAINIIMAVFMGVEKIEVQTGQMIFPDLLVNKGGSQTPSLAGSRTLLYPLSTWLSSSPVGRQERPPYPHTLLSVALSATFPCLLVPSTEM